MPVHPRRPNQHHPLLSVEERESTRGDGSLYSAHGLLEPCYEHTAHLCTVRPSPCGVAFNTQALDQAQVIIRRATLRQARKPSVSLLNKHPHPRACREAMNRRPPIKELLSKTRKITLNALLPPSREMKSIALHLRGNVSPPGERRPAVFKLRTTRPSRTIASRPSDVAIYGEHCLASTGALSKRSTPGGPRDAAVLHAVDAHPEAIDLRPPSDVIRFYMPSRASFAYPYRPTPFASDLRLVLSTNRLCHKVALLSLVRPAPDHVLVKSLRSSSSSHALVPVGSHVLTARPRLPPLDFAYRYRAKPSCPNQVAP
ncbi:hypothetical protein EV714DRAFT_235477 [Schizophyllum commune]